MGTNATLKHDSLEREGEGGARGEERRRGGRGEREEKGREREKEGKGRGGREREGKRDLTLKECSKLSAVNQSMGSTQCVTGL